MTSSNLNILDMVVFSDKIGLGHHSFSCDGDPPLLPIQQHITVKKRLIKLTAFNERR
ncbi:MAG: hypothetical protein ACR5K4_01955 [Sodalis sp. (in: enterobacteria)]